MSVACRCYRLNVPGFSGPPPVEWSERGLPRAWRDTWDFLGKPWTQTALLLVEIGIGVAAITRPILVVCLVLPPLLVFLIMCGVAPYRQRNEARTQRDSYKELNPHDRRHVLGLLLGRGDVYLKQAWLAGVKTSLDGPMTIDGTPVHTSYIEEVEKRASEWRTEVATYLDTNFGKAEVSLFWSDVGIPELGPPDFDEAKARQEAGAYRNMQRRIYRLQELLEKTTY